MKINSRNKTSAPAKITFPPASEFGHFVGPTHIWVNGQLVAVVSPSGKTYTVREKGPEAFFPRLHGETSKEE